MKYQVIKEIGCGTYGQVYLATYESKKFAIKMVNLEPLESEKREKVMSEITIHKKLGEHPHVALLLDSFIVDSTLHLVMKYYSQGDLYSRIVNCQKRKCWLNETAVLRYLVDITFGLRYIHSQGVIHRDIKPENVYIDRYNRCCIGDFGLSRIVESLKPLLLSKVGSHFYIAPEVLMEKPYSSQVDVFSLGCLLFTLCTHKIAFMNLEELMVEDDRSLIPRIEFPSHYSPLLKLLVEDMLQCVPEKRPTAEDLLKSHIVQNYLNGDFDLVPKT